jgi:hypothetical protein
MQMVRWRVLAIAFSLALLALVSSGGGGRAATDRTAKVVVITSGVVPEGEGLGSGDYGYADYGLVLRNRSPREDRQSFAASASCARSRSAFMDRLSAIALLCERELHATAYSPVRYLPRSAWLAR